MSERRALLVGVPVFTAATDDGSLSNLDFAAPAVEELAAVLRDAFGFSVTTLTEPRLTGAQIGAAVRSALESTGPDAVLIIHLLTHGAAQDEHLYALGSDALIHESTEIGHWLASLQHTEVRPLVLFTLDLCNSGIVTSLPWQARYDRGGRRGWVIAACEPDMDAFNGHFSTALTIVLRDIAADSLEVDASFEHIPLETLARAVRRTVTRLADISGSYRQYVTASSVDVSVDPPVLPFFANPSYARSPGERPRAAADLALQPFLADLDETLDARHFIERAAGSAAIYDVADSLTGWFTGRTPELAALSRWMNGAGDQSLALVTGSPGSGKSAMLGLLTCAAHPELREHTRKIWSRGTHTPLPVTHLAAVHARQRGIAAICTGLGRQLRLGDELAPDEFLAQVQVIPGQQPVLIIDALDEAVDSAAIAEWLARLAALTRPDGSLAVRLLVASRAYEECEPLRALAHGPVGREFNLDDVRDDVLADNLYRYVTDLLREVPAFREAHTVTGAFAGRLAEAVVGSRGRGWGEFLVAGIYTRHFIATFQPREGADAAERRGAGIPQTLPDVLELDLEHRRAEPWLRPVLNVLAHARGRGMPASVITRVASAFWPEAPEPPSLSEIRSALRAARFYLRPSTDTDKVTVYRLFHEGLAGYLRGRSDGGAVSRPHLAGLGQASRRVWAAAEPYALRHALDHASDTTELLTDPGFLLHADPATYLPLLDQETRQLVGEWAGQALPDKRARFARLAAAAGQPELARRIADLPGEQPLTWLPAWALGKPDTTRPTSREPVVAALDERGRLELWNWEVARADHAGRITAFALGRRDGRLVLVTGEQDGTVRLAGLEDAPVIVSRHRASVAALAIVEHGEGCLVLSGGEDHSVSAHIVTAASARQFRSSLTVPGAPARMLAAGGPFLAPVVACVNGIGQLWAWQLGAAENSPLYQWTPPAPVRSAAVANLSGRPVIVAVCSDGVARTWDYATRTRLKEFGGPGDAIRTLAVGSADGRAVAVTGGQDGSIRIWDLLTGRPQGTPLPVSPGPVRAITVRATPSGLLCLVGAADRTVLWDPARRRPLREFDLRGATSVAMDLSGLAHPVPGPAAGPVRLTALAVTGEGGQELAILGDEQGSAQVLDIRSGRPRRTALPGDGHPVTSIEITHLAGRMTSIIRSETRIKLCQLPTGDSVVLPAEQHPGEPARSWDGHVIVGGSLARVRRTADGAVLLDDDVLGRHQDSVTAITTTYVAGRPTAISGDMSGWVRIWDLADRQLASELNVGAPVFAIAATTNGWLLVGAGGCAYAFQHLTARQVAAADRAPVRPPARRTAGSPSPCAD